MPQVPIFLAVDIFDVWGIDFIGPFPKSGHYEYIYSLKCRLCLELGRSKSYNNQWLQKVAEF